MQIKVTGRHMPVTDSIREYAEEKISKAGKLHDRDEMTIDVVLHVEKNPANTTSVMSPIGKVICQAPPPWASSRTFEGFTSRCRMPAACAA